MTARQTKLTIGIAVLVIVAIGSVVGVLAMRMGRRAPRAGGFRVAVVDVRGPAWAEDAVERAIGAVPSEQLRSRRHALARKDKDATLVDAAKSIDLDAIVSGSVDAGKVHLDAFKPAETTPLASADGINLADVARMLSSTWGTKPMAPPTANLDAYSAFADGKRAREEGKLDEAATRFRSAIALDASCDACKVALAEATASAPDVDESKLDERDVLLARGLKAFASNKAEDATNAFRAMTVAFPEDAMGHLWLGRAYHRLLHAHDEALHHLDNARRLAPDHFDVVSEISDCWLGLGERDDAARVIKAYLKIVPDDAAATAKLSSLEHN
jgi:tetratricopeptide (TPR) repeat protein